MSKGGYEHVLIITDHFTRYAQAIPTRNETAHTTAKVLFEQFICHYGFPSRLHSDQGRNFESSVIKELCKLANIDKCRTTPYHPQCNGMAERFNQTLMNMLGTLEDDQKQNWKAYTPSLVHSYNSTIHESTGFTPHYLMFGRHPRLAIDAFLGIQPNQSLRAKDKSSYVCGLRDRLRFAYKVASKESRKQARRHKRKYDLRVREVNLEPGDRVLVRKLGLKGRQKLADRWDRDIYVVIDRPNEDVPVFRVRKEHSKGPVRTLHRNLLLPCLSLPSDPSSESSSIPETQATPSDTLNASNNSVELSKSPGKTRTDKTVSSQTPAESSGKYVIPARRLNPDAQPFAPRRSDRERKKPTWMASRDWKVP